MTLLCYIICRSKTDVKGKKMKVAVIGSRGLRVGDLHNYLPEDTTEIVSGGAYGIDTCAEEYAKKSGIPFTKIRPNYDEHGRQAPILRNIEIVTYADTVLAFWDGKSKGTRFVIEYCRKHGIPVKIFVANT